jgi:Trk K+ transport system NAD-binding subunit
VPGTSELNRVSAIVLRFMRTPLLLLIAVYGIGVTGMALMPGQDAAGNPSRMNLFHAFYFFTYTATTTGFGEIPNQFSDEQRLWATVCLLIGVVAWLYAIGSIIRLAQHPEFLKAMAERRFDRSVRRIAQPFYVICGFGDTGSLLARGLSDYYCAAAVIDIDTERIKALGLRDYHVSMPGLCADASVPKHLLDAGVRLSNCRAVVALTSSDAINLKIAVMARSLNPEIQIICRFTDQRLREHLDTLGDVIAVDPFEIFAQRLSIALRVHLLYIWEEWLFGATGVDWTKPVQPPKGKWIICGYGRMGQAVQKAMHAKDVPTVIIDPADSEEESDLSRIQGRAGNSTLQQAGIEEAVGIVAGTDSDEDNLGILLGSRALNPEAFLVVRQNHHENELAFNAANANLIMQPSLVTARRIFLTLVAPEVRAFVEYLRHEGRILIPELAGLTQRIFGSNPADVWRVEITGSGNAVIELKERGIKVTFRDLSRHPADRNNGLSLLALVLQRNGKMIMLPDSSRELQIGDSILFCGTEKARRLLSATLENPYTLYYLHTGEDDPRSWFAQWLTRVQ